MTIQLPQPASEEEFGALDRTAPIFLEAIQYGFSDEVGALLISATTDGSYPVFYAGREYVAKLFAPLHDDFFRTELAVLGLLSDNSRILAPKLVRTTRIDGWNAILMTRLTGKSLQTNWPTIDTKEKEALCESLGDLTRALHGLDPTTITAVCPGWDEFLVTQRLDCAADQIKRGLTERLARQIPDFLASSTLALLWCFTPRSCLPMFLPKMGTRVPKFPV